MLQKLQITCSNLSENAIKISITIEFSLFVISYFLLFVIRYLVLFAIRYALFGIICSNYTNNE